MTRSPFTRYEIDLITQTAIGTLGWTGLVSGPDEHTEPAHECVDQYDEWESLLSKDDRARIREVVADFLESVHQEVTDDELAEYMRAIGVHGDPGCHAIGHDFILTAQRQGAGFWDRGAGEVGDKLTELSHGHGLELHGYDDGEGNLSLYLEG